MKAIRSRLKYILILLYFALAANLYSETVISSDINNNQTWTAAGAPYRIISDVKINPLGSLEILPGTKIRFERNRSLIVKGTLLALGTEDSPVIFTADGSNVRNPFWGCISIEASADKNIRFQNCEINYAGGNDAGAIVYSGGCRPVFRNISMTGNKYNGIEILHGSYESDLIVPSSNVPYFTKGTVNIDPKSSLLINPGVIWKFPSSGDLIVNGQIYAFGKSDSTIIFTSLNDDESGDSDTGGDGITYGNPSDWGGVMLSGSDNDSSRLANVEIRFGGGSAETYSSLACFEDCSPKVESCVFNESGYYGVMAIGAASPDFGGGERNSSGLNIFEGFDSRRYAFVNRSEADINAKNNCWGKSTETEISYLIQDHNDRDRFGTVHFVPYRQDCGPSVPPKTELLSPKEHTNGLPLEIEFSWEPSLGADSYILQISKNSRFENAVYDIAAIRTPAKLISGLEPATGYFWRVLARNSIGDGPWSDVWSFKTMDTAKPATPLLISPAEASAAHDASILFIWSLIHNADVYELQISSGADFQKIIYKNDTIALDNIRLSVFQPYTRYFWRVRSRNFVGNSAWSVSRSFSTGEFSAAEVPESWQFERKTGENCQIVIRTGVKQEVEGHRFRDGDAIGAFYYRGDELHCAGFAEWNPEENIAITVWGDNYQTPEKDGFESGEQFRFKIWDSNRELEIPAAVEYESGFCYFVSDTVSVIETITNLDTFRIKLYEDENVFVSSPLAPFYSSFKEIIGEEIFAGAIPESGHWNANEGYSVFSGKDSELEIIGDRIQPRSLQITIEQGMNNLIPYPYLVSCPVAEVLKNIPDNNYIALNSSGGVFAPEYGINTISTVNPGEALNIFSGRNMTISYPADENIDTDNIPGEMPVPQHYVKDVPKSGNFMIIVLESDEFHTGDEIAIFDADGNLCGSASVLARSAIVAVAGDNPFTKDIIEGPTDGDELVAELWSGSAREEFSLRIISMKEYFDDQKIEAGLEYSDGSVIKLKLAKSASSVQFEVETKIIDVYPNPVQDYLFIPVHGDSHFSPGIFDSMGNEIHVNSYHIIRKAHSMIINTKDLSRGMYFVRVECEGMLKIGKFIKI